MRHLIVIFLSCVVSAFFTYALAQELFKLTIENHTFTPTSLTVPANTRFKIEVENRDATPAEFESSDIHVEKIIVGRGTISVFVSPLKPGTYVFFDDYHPDSAKGTITAKAP